MTMFENKALRAFLRGAALPGMIVSACAVIGLLMDVFRSEPILGTISGFQAGIALGLFFSLWGGLEIMISIFFISEDAFRYRFIRMLGYFSVWAGCIFIILKVAN
ncbi:MAG: hypothetical protein ABJ275_00555 [Maricaulaceae bacterium]